MFIYVRICCSSSLCIMSQIANATGFHEKWNKTSIGVDAMGNDVCVTGVWTCVNKQQSIIIGRWQSMTFTMTYFNSVQEL